MLKLTLTIRTLRPLSLAWLLLSATSSLSSAQEFRWRNADSPGDVNADLSVWADDVMPIVNCLNGVSDYCVSDPEGGPRFSNALNPPPFLDVMPTDTPSPVDALVVINMINQTLPRTPPVNPITTAQEGFKVRLATTDATGNPLDTVGTGETFLLKAYVSDTRPNALGVFAAYLAIAYPSQLVEPAGAIDYGLDFPNGQAGDTETAGLLDNLGGMIDRILPPTNSEEHLLLTMPLRGVAGGDATFALQDTASYGLLFGIDPFVTTVPTSVQIRVVPEPSSYLLAMTVGSWLILQARRRWR